MSAPPERQVKIGVLSIQGAFAEHVSMLERERDVRKERVKITVEEIRNPTQLADLDGLIIPGGESTTLSVFLRQNDFEEKLRLFMSRETRPGFVWGTCAGLILLSDELDSQKRGGQVTVCQSHFTKRDLYGSASCLSSSASKLIKEHLFITQCDVYGFS